MGEETLDEMADRVAEQHPALPKGVIQRIAVEEHQLLTTLAPDHVMPEIVVEAVEERVERLDTAALELGGLGDSRSASRQGD